MVIYCPGAFECNGVVKSDVVVAYFIGATIHLNDNAQAYTTPKTALTLAPFGADTLTRSVFQPARGKTCYTLPDREWEIAGTDLGALQYGPLHDPRDGEFELRPVHAFRARARYSPHKLSLEFSGRTESGFEVVHVDGKVEKLGLAPWDFRVCFEVERDGLREFLQLPTQHLDSFLAQLDEL